MFYHENTGEAVQVYHVFRIVLFADGSVCQEQMTDQTSATTMVTLLADALQERIDQGIVAASYACADASSEVVSWRVHRAIKRWIHAKLPKDHVLYELSLLGKLTYKDTPLTYKDAKDLRYGGYTVHGCTLFGIMRDYADHAVKVNSANLGWNWTSLQQEMETEQYRYDALNDSWYRQIYIGTVFNLAPSGKYYMPWTTNQTLADVYADGIWYEMAEHEAEAHGMSLDSGEGDPCDLFLSQGADVTDIDPAAVDGDSQDDYDEQMAAYEE